MVQRKSVNIDRILVCFLQKKRTNKKIKYLYKICRRLHNRECSDICKILQCWYKGRLDHIHFHLHTRQRLNKVRQTERNKIVKMC